MSSRLFLRLIAVGFGMFLLSTITNWMYVLQQPPSSIEVPDVTEEDPIISALRDVIPPSLRDDTFDCRRLFGSDTVARNFSMSGYFRSKVGEFLAAVDAVEPEVAEGSSFQMETEYRLLHYLTSRLEFVRTVCETGTNNDEI